MGVSAYEFFSYAVAREGVFWRVIGIDNPRFVRVERRRAAPPWHAAADGERVRKRNLVARRDCCRYRVTGADCNRHAVRSADGNAYEERNAIADADADEANFDAVASTDAEAVPIAGSNRHAAPGDDA
jgi:hypothetical protein